jgi:hypothetical protein
MAMFYEVERYLRAPLEDVLLKLYPAGTLKWCYEAGARAVLEAHPGALPQPPEPRRQLPGQSAPKKAYLVSLLIAILRNPELGREFYESLPPSTRKALTAVAWERQVNLAELEKRLGLSIAYPNPDQRFSYQDPFILQPEHSLLVVRESRDRYYGYSSEKALKPQDFKLVLPEAVRQVLKAWTPPPPGYELTPSSQDPAPPCQVYSCASKALPDLRLVAEYIAQGHLKYTKSEQVALPSIKALLQMTGGPEFFENADDPDLALLRTRLLVGGMAFIQEKERQRMLSHPDNAEQIRFVLERVLANAAFLHEELLGHIPMTRNRWCQYSPQSVKQLASFFGKLPGDGWISYENMRSYHTLREELPTLFGQGKFGLEAVAFADDRRYYNTMTVSEENAFLLMGEPLLKGYAFLLAALGLAEIAYTPPGKAIYHRPKHTYLSPFDGLGFARLTPLGELVFRRRNSLDVAAVPAARAPITLDETRLLATCRDPDPLTKLTLNQFFEEIAPGRYQMTPKSLVGGCASQKDIMERLRLLRRVVSALPPPVWEAFFDKTLARIAPLEPEPDYVILKVTGDQEARRLMATDPVLKEIVLKVEGLRIAVRRTDLKKLAKRLEQFGYLSPLPGMG